MKNFRTGCWRLLTMALLAGVGPSALACSVCFGESDSRMAQGMNMGIFVLLLIITSVLGGVASFFVYLAKRSAQIENGHQISTGLSEHRTNA